MCADETAARRKRLLWRATHRGIREMDLLLGNFVAERIDIMSVAELDELEAIIEIPDQQMLAWATRQSELPAERRSPLLEEVLGLRR